MGLIYGFRILPETRLEAFNDCIITLACFIGSFQLYCVTKRFDREDEVRINWLLFCIGLFLEGAGHAIYSVSEFLIGDTISFPYYSDYFIAAGETLYIFSFRSFLLHFIRSDMLPKNRRESVSNILFIVILLAQIAFYLIPSIKTSEDSIWEQILYLIYPLLDLTIAYYCVHLALALYSMGHSPIAKPWIILVAAFFVFLITDTVYMYIELWEMYHPYLWINPGWGLAYFLISYAAFRQRKLMDFFDTVD